MFQSALLGVDLILWFTTWGASSHIPCQISHAGKQVFSNWRSLRLPLSASYNVHTSGLISSELTGDAVSEAVFKSWAQKLTEGVFDLALVELQQHLANKVRHILQQACKATWVDNCKGLFSISVFDFFFNLLIFPWNKNCEVTHLCKCFYLLFFFVCLFFYFYKGGGSDRLWHTDFTHSSCRYITDRVSTDVNFKKLECKVDFFFSIWKKTYIYKGRLCK